MELKEAILSTLAELEDDDMESVCATQTQEEQIDDDQHERAKKEAFSVRHNGNFELDAREVLEVMTPKDPPLMPMAKEGVLDQEYVDEVEGVSAESHMPLEESDRKFLEGLRERILVMFEGMQSPNNRAAEAKIDLILNFFEWQLSLIDERLEKGSACENKKKDTIG